MATVTSALYRGAAATTSTTLYTTPALTTAIITNIVITNTAGTAASVTISLNGIVMLPAVSIAANSIAAFDLKQVLPAGQILAGFATATTVNFHVSGVYIN